MNKKRETRWWRWVMLSLIVAGAEFSCGTSTIGNPGGSVVTFTSYDGDTLGAMFKYQYDSPTQSWVVTIESSTSIPTPGTPLGDSVVFLADTGTYFSQNLSAMISGSVEYRFCFISLDTAFSLWQPDTVIRHAWPAAGINKLMVQARSCRDTSEHSMWSRSLSVRVQ